MRDENKKAVSSRAPQKITAGILVVACVAIGLVGLVLPIIPGVLFLAIAALVAAKHFPSVNARLRTHRTLGKHLSNADRFGSLSFSDKVQLAGWTCVKALADGVVLVRSLLGKLGAALR